ncbi:MAG TPA: hypothetical protein VKX49_22700 [Bryobacteraceae bacterium]|nr:hypothetical protein [Bryobacteraceae bacterium]
MCWMRYRDKDGVRRRESTLTGRLGRSATCLRERLQARDNNTLPAVRRRQELIFGEWSDFYLGELFQAAQGDANVFKKYSQLKREALAKLN